MSATKPIASHAFADESYHRGTNTYVVGGVVVPATQLVSVRHSAIRVLPPGRQWTKNPFHWNKDKSRSRRTNLLLDTVLAYSLPAYSITMSNVPPGQEESARVACLEAFVLEAIAQGAVGITVDQRNPSQTQIDRRTMIHIRTSGMAPKNFGHAFAYPSNEPILSIADAIAGATGCELTGDSTYCLVLGGQLLRKQA